MSEEATKRRSDEAKAGAAEGTEARRHAGTKASPVGIKVYPGMPTPVKPVKK